MIINDNEEIKEQVHDHYEDFKLRQTIYIFEDLTETIEIVAKDKDGKIIDTKIFQPTFIKTHLDVQFQDKGLKSEESLYEMVRVKKV